MTLSLPLRFDRSPKRVLYLTGHQLTGYEWRNGRITDGFLFQAGEEGLSDFSAYLYENPAEPTYLLADLVEEEYRRDTIPHVHGRDRRDLLKNRAARLFRDTSYWTAVPQGRESSGRRDDRVLYAALTNPALLIPWLERIRQHKVPLVGIYSLPLLSQELLAELGVDAGRNLVVSLQSAGNLRQSFFVGRDLKLSRLAHMPSLQVKQACESIMDEVEKLRRYLYSLRLLFREDVLNVYLLAHGDMYNELRRLRADDATVRYHAVDLADLGQRLGMNERLISSSTDAVFAHLLLRATPRNHYAPADETRYHRMYRLRHAMLAASMLVSLGGLSWGGLEVVKGLIIKERSQATRLQADYYQQRYRQARGTLPQIPAEPNDLKAAVDTADLLAQKRTTPLEMVTRISLGLEQYPLLRVDEISWRVDADPEASLAGGETKKDPYARKKPRTGLYHLALLSGQVEGFDGNYRQALEMIRGFADTLRGLRGIEQVKIMSLPLNVSSNESLSGDAGTRAAQGRALFKVRLVYRKDDGTV